MVTTSWPSSRKLPLVGRSRQPRVFMSVDLPEPEGPTDATYSPRSMESVASFRRFDLDFAQVVHL
jgi:hypothetical protein